MGVAPLLAPSGVTMRVVSRAASFTWGSWSVTWPEGFEEPDPPGEDRELGWIADLGGDEVEPFGRCFVRADAQIDARIGRSNVEDVLDAARFRTSGEVFLEAQIPNENLAGQLPYRDFGVNSFVPVRVGGRILEGQLVTRVEESEDELGHRAVSVFVGGQKFQDREALRTQNRELDRVIAQERLERGDEIGARLAASQEYEREKREDLKKYVDQRDGEVTEHADTVANTAELNAKEHAEGEDKKVLSSAKSYATNEDKKLKRSIDLVIGSEGSLTKQVRELNSDYQAKLGANGSVIADQAAHQRLLEGMVHGKPVSELSGTAFAQQQQAVNEMNAAFQGKQTSINEGFDYLFGLNEKINLAQDYLIERNRIMAEAFTPRMVSLNYDVEYSRLRLSSYEGQSEDQSGTLLIEEARISHGKRISSIYLPTSIGFRHAVYHLEATVLNGQGHWKRSVFAVTNNTSAPGVEGNAISLAFDKGDDTFQISTVRIFGVVIPTVVLPQFKDELDDLAFEYRDKGLRV